jgi:N-acetylglutamate synthase-like GNAT family acetyltransferase
MEFKLINWGSTEYDEMVALRDEILRKPLGLHFSEEYLEAESNDILIACYLKGVMAGCCILRTISEDVLQLKQMAVRGSFQNEGIGLKIISFAEETARNIGHCRIFMHARKEVKGFYEKAGYETRGDEFEEVGIPHIMMIKELKPREGF